MPLKEYVIIGGGTAGLAAALRLLEHGEKPLVIESGTYPSHKVCGEFFSAQCVPFLKRWGLAPVEVHEAHFHHAAHSFTFRFPEAAGSLSHFTCDPQLAKKVEESGGTVLTKTKVEKIEPRPDGYEIKLDSGAVIKASRLLIATGRMGQKKVECPYIGVKAHFEGLNTGALEMFLFDSAYVGVSPIEGGKFNVAALALNSKFKGIEPLIQSSPRMQKLFAGGRQCFDWMSTPVPPFGVKNTQNWPHAYLIGDAAGTIPPITGNGLSMSVQSAIMAADFAVKKDAEGFRKAWKASFKSSIFWGGMLHQLAMRPSLSTPLMRMCYYCPSIAQGLFRLTRGCQ